MIGDVLKIIEEKRAIAEDNYRRARAAGDGREDAHKQELDRLTLAKEWFESGRDGVNGY